MCCSCGMCYEYMSSDHNLKLSESNTTMNMFDSCGDSCANSGGFCYDGTCYSPDECDGKCDDDCETCLCGTCLRSRTTENGVIPEPSYLYDATLASGGLAAVCLLGLLGRFSVKAIRNRQYQKLDGTLQIVRGTSSLNEVETQDEMCYQNFKISPDLNVSQVYF